MEAFNAWLLATVSLGWGLWALAFAAFFDALIIPIPTELMVLALASAYRSTGAPAPWSVFAVCALAFAGGDVCTYWLGRSVPLRRIVFFRSSLGKSVVSWAHRAFEYGGGFFTVASRFVPSGRTVINLIAGAARYPLARYLPLAALAGFLWSIYMWTLGYLAAGWLSDNPLAVMGLGFLAGMVVGAACDAVMKLVSRAR
ncbi:putative SNARE-like domain protein [Bifidobacterium actinocoloniiforme DSM 22766]|uniref:Putative SNARE-like domain protein n=1 Tax=Bifidobacterium actinocoloniiforme DSM 22766 TaxID=1437605 RepID=A0A086Z0Y5_9BIFI|nr:VTT domain-containing protein [Bifidobacterium actinocoloniiforme]KFI40185.1 putative SNARE-like domain protein [Bifidobacterium actinocoloniiforme DSM 22766]